MAVMSTNAVMANPVTHELTFGVSVSYNGQIQHFEEDMRPFIIDGRTFLPVRAIADITGFYVDFDGETNTVLLSSGREYIASTSPQPNVATTITRELTFGVAVSFNDEIQEFTEDMRPFIIDGRTFLPVRAIADIAGLDVGFDGVTNTVLLTNEGAIMATQNATPHPLQPIWDAVERFPQTVVNENPPLQSGDAGNFLRIGHFDVSGTMSGFLGGAVFNTTALDSALGELAGLNWSIFSANSNRAFGETGIATYTVNIEQMYMHITLNHDVLWHDGAPLTLDDLVFAYEIIAHPDYVGMRFTSAIQSVRGIMDYHEGRADYISGMVLSDDSRELRIYFDEMPPSHLHFGIWSTPTPRHAFDGIAVADMLWSDPVRVNPIGWGPFRVVAITPEFVRLEAFEDFFFGRPLIDRVTKEVVQPDLMADLLTLGYFDIAEFPIGWYLDHQNRDNFQLLSILTGTYSYTAFRLGHWDTENNVVVVDETRPTADHRLRQAMAYAIDQQLIIDTVWSGLPSLATSIIPPIHSQYLDTSLQGFPFNLDRANELLDEAGFDMRDSQGYRLNQNGEPMTLILGIHEAGGNHFTAMAMIQQWSNIGIRVELHQGRLHEFSSFIDDMRWDADGGVVDLMFGHWIPGFNPNPAGIWGAHTSSNFSRFTNAELERVFENLSSMQAWNDDFRMEQYIELQRLFHEYSPAIINHWRAISLVAVNNRVTGYTTIISDETTPFGASQNWHLIGVTSPRPY